MKPTNFKTPEKWNSVEVPERVALRAFTKKVVRADGCHISTYSTASHGYAQIGWKGETKNQMVLAHRAAWVHVNGQVPIGMTIDHTCKTRVCVNVDHMRLLSNYENARRTSGRDWPVGFCVNGHDPSHQISVTRSANESGKSNICGTCAKNSQKRYRQRKQESTNR